MSIQQPLRCGRSHPLPNDQVLYRQSNQMSINIPACVFLIAPPTCPKSDTIIAVPKRPKSHWVTSMLLTLPSPDVPAYMLLSLIPEYIAHVTHVQCQCSILFTAAFYQLNPTSIWTCFSSELNTFFLSEPMWAELNLFACWNIFEFLFCWASAKRLAACLVN